MPELPEVETVKNGLIKKVKGRKIIGCQVLYKGIMIKATITTDTKALEDINKKIVALGEKLDKLVVATCDVHFMDPQDEIYRRILMAGQGFDDADEQAPLYLRTTAEIQKAIRETSKGIKFPSYMFQEMKKDKWNIASLDKPVGKEDDATIVIFKHFTLQRYR